MDNITKVQKEVNSRMSKMIHILNDMLNFKIKFHVRTTPMNILERIVMIVKARSFNIKKIYVREERIDADNVEEWLKKGLNARRILKYKKDTKSFNWIVWYI